MLYLRVTFPVKFKYSPFNPAANVCLNVLTVRNSIINDPWMFCLSNLQEPKEEEEGEEENGDEEEKDKKVDQEFLVCSFECLGQAWPKNSTDSQGQVSFPTLAYAS